jgi:ABC-2 type transport system ATP-binding protein
MQQGALIAEGPPGALIDGLDHEVCEVIGGAREALHEVLEHHPDVVAASPAGALLRVVLRPGSRERIEAKLSEYGATLQTTSATFEDLFLARISEAA